jgi:hypothetical protein
MPITDEQVLRERLDLEMIERPHLWPHIRRGFPLLFLKRLVAGEQQTAMCLKDSDCYIVCAHIWPKARDQPVTREIIEYPDAEAVRADGWVVD